MREKDHELDRRDFLKKGAQATAAATAAVILSSTTSRGSVPEDTKITLTDAMPTRVLGKTNVEQLEQ